MDPFSIAIGLAQFAPTILRFLGVGEKAASVADKVVGIATSLTGAKSPEEALDMIKQDRQMQLAFQQKMLEMDGDLEKAYLADRADARARDAKFLAAGTRNYRADALTLLAVAIVSAITYFVWKSPVTGDFEKATITLILGRFLGYLDSVFQFEFGSTRSSKTKDETIANLSK
jgi:hypothetical protein